MSDTDGSPWWGSGKAEVEQQIPYPRAWAQRSRGDLACKHVDVTNTSIRPAIEGYMRKTAHRHKCSGKDGTGQTHRCTVVRALTFPPPPVVGISQGVSTGRIPCRMPPREIPSREVPAWRVPPGCGGEGGSTFWEVPFGGPAAS